MPNHCTNRLIVLGPLERVDALIRLMRGPKSCFDFGKIKSCPQELLDTPANATPSPKRQENMRKYGYADWYEWTRDNWGTKWNAYSVQETPALTNGVVLLSNAHGELPDRQIEYGFDTAWVPPMPIIKALVERFPECIFTHDYIDEGSEFSGHVIYADGDFDNPLEEVGGEDDVCGITEWHERFRWHDDEEEE